MNKIDFFKTVTVIDTETTNLHADQAEIVEVAGATYTGESWESDSKLLGCRDGIPPEASAKNHISNRMIDGLPTFAEAQLDVKAVLRWNVSNYFVAHNCKYDQEVLAKAWAEAAAFEDYTDVEQALDQRRWICTFRLSKQLLNDIDFADMQYNLNYLRYKLDLPVSDEITSHRAGDDTLVCATLFEFLVEYALATGQIAEGSDIGEQLHTLCWKPISIGKWPFGKHKGKNLSEIDTDYYMWAMQNIDSLNEDKAGYDSDLAASVAEELERRL